MGARSPHCGRTPLCCPYCPEPAWPRTWHNHGDAGTLLGILVSSLVTKHPREHQHPARDTSIPKRPGTAMGTLAHCFTPWCEHWGCHNNTPHPRDTCTLLGTWHSAWETGTLPGDAGTAPGDIGTPVGTLTHTPPHPRGLAQCLGNWQNSWRCWHSPWGHRHAAGDGDTQPMGPPLRDTGTALRDTVTSLGLCHAPGDPVMSPGIPSHCWGP